MWSKQQLHALLEVVVMFAIVKYDRSSSLMDLKVIFP